MRALILAAGLGTRLAPITDNCPKSLVPVNGKPILVRQIENLLESGVSDITVVSGYKGDILEERVHRQFPDVRIIDNSVYADTNNMYSAYLARNVVEGDSFLMMNADVFFDSSVIRGLLDFEADDAIVTDMGTYLEESMKVVEREGRLMHISKTVTREEALGSSIDVYKFSARGGRAFFRECERYIDGRRERKLWSEVALDGILGEVEFRACPLRGRWMEVDTLEDLAEAERIFSDIHATGDYFGADVNILTGKRLYLFDMDGTIYRGEDLFDGTLKLLDHIRQTGGRYVFITNNSSKSVDDYMEKLRRFGIETEKDSFFTSSQATLLYLRENYPGVKVYCQGTKSLVNELREGGLDVTEEIEGDVGLVLVGYDTELTMGKVRKTCQLLQRDIPFIGTNPDLCCPVESGFVPDCGSICMMIGNATGRKPVYVGKPNPQMVQLAAGRLGFMLEETVVVGDRLYTDIASGINAGVVSVCVLTGEATVADILQGKIKPTLTFKDVQGMLNALKSLGAI